MKKPKIQSPLRWVKWRVLLLCVALMGLVFFMRYVTTSSFQESLQFLFGDLRSWNWCAPGTTQVTFEGASPESVNDPENVRKLCQIGFQPVDADAVKAAHFVRLMTSLGAEGKISVLEGDLATQVFKVDGLPFRSPSLEKAWAGRTPP